jgi:hypothetical protein
VCCARDVRGLDDSTTTDRDGRFAFRGVVAGTYAIGARSTDSGISARDVKLGDGEHRVLDLALDRTGAIAGHVVDAQRAPVAYATVVLDGDAHCNTDARGAFRCVALGAGPYRPSVLAPSSQQPLHDAFEPLVVGTTDATLVVDAPSVALRGTVVDDSGAAIADAQVTALPTTGDNVPVFHAWLRLPTTQTDESGAFSLGDLTAGRYAIRARSPVGEVVQIAPTSERVTLTLVRPASLTGSLTGFATPPQVYARAAGAEIEGRVDGTTFTFPRLPPGHFVISATGGDAQPIDLGPGVAATLVLAARPTGTVDAVVEDFRTHAPLAGAICHAVPTTGDERGVTPWDLPRDPRSDSAGHVALSASGSVDIQCMMPSPERWSPPSVHLVVPASGRASALLESVEILGDHPGDVGIDLDPLATAPRIAGVHAPGIGLKPGELVTAVDGVSVSTLGGGGVLALLVSHAPGTTATITVGGRTIQLMAH